MRPSNVLTVLGFVIVGMLASRSASAQVCPGDCDRDRVVTVDEITTGINLALDQAAGEDRYCFAFGQGFVRRVDVTDILRAITRLLEGCGLESLEDLERRRQENLAKWEATGIDDYEIDYERGCFCIGPFHVRVLVRDGEIVSVRDAETGEDVANPFPGGPTAFNSIEGVFAIIDIAIVSRATTLVVDYHPELGYPERVSIDYVDEIADDEVTIRITALRPLRNEEQ